MTPGVMSDSAIVTHNEPGIKTDPSPNNAAAALNNNRSGKQREEATENGIRIKKEDEDEEDSKIMDMSVLAPALPHITQGFYPLSRLIGRMAQESHTMFYDLTEAIQHQRDMVRREAVLAHVMERRSQWIKILVLTMWAKRAKDVSTAIDLKVMLDQINDHYNMANYELFGLRRDLANAKVPNPDIRTAIEVLSTGKAPGVPSYNYIPPPPLTTPQILKLLRNIDTLLSIRLNLYDKIPQHFKDYRIGDGRATFWIPDEFEVDVTIADEDPASQLYIIDFRLTYEPAVKALPVDRFRTEIEARGNDILRTKGLEGLYEFLHDFVMTHKIMTLLRQVKEMVAGRWTQALNVNLHKRTLLIYYWIRKPSPRSWIEVGVMRPRGKEPSRLGVRWHREGKEVKDVQVPINVKCVSAEELIKAAIALHTNYFLTTIRNNIAPLPIFPPSSLSLITSDTDSFESQMQVKLTTSRTLTVLVEPITGRFALRKQSGMTSQAEEYINAPGVDTILVATENITKLRFLNMQEEIESRGKSMGWEIIKQLSLRRETLMKWFGRTTKYMTYMRRSEWRKQWVVVVSFGDNGDAWWVAEINEATQGWNMPDVQRIPIKGVPNVTYQFLENLEKMASGLISHYVNTRVLAARNVQYSLRPSINNDNAVRIPDLMIRFDHLMKQNWGLNVLRCCFHGIAANGHATIIVQGRTKEPMTQLKSSDITATDTDVAFHPQTGSFALRFVVPVGDDVVDAIIERLHRIERLIGFVSVIRKYKLPCHHVSLGRIAFRYGKEVNATAEISFAGDKNMQLHLPELSPHIRIRHFLEQQLNDNGLETVVKNLAITQNILVALDEIENVTPEGELFVLSRSTEWYRMDYPKRNHVIDIQLKLRKSEYGWHVRDAALTSPNPERLTIGNVGVAGGARVAAPALTEFWFNPGLKGVTGLKTGLVAHIGDVSAAVRKVHNLVLPSAPVGAQNGKNPPDSNAPPANQTRATLVLPSGGSNS